MATRLPSPCGQVGGVCDHNQGPGLAPEGELDRAPVLTLKIAREWVVLVRGQEAAVHGVLQSLPAKAVEVGGGAVDPEAQAQNPACFLYDCHGLVKEGAQGRVGQ